MKHQISILVAAAVAVAIPAEPYFAPGKASVIQHHVSTNQQQPIVDVGEPEKFLVETAPGESRWVTEDEKWELRRQNINFIDITNLSPTPSSLSFQPLKVNYPSSPSHNSSIARLLPHLSELSMRTHLEKFTSFYTRYYKSSYGAESSAWLLSRVRDMVAESGALDHKATVEPFTHPWGQNSVIARLPGQTNATVVIGAHQDSVNMYWPSMLAAPGADDDGSGTVTILEALAALLRDDDVVRGRARNTLEFHWYSAEEGGLLGSQAVFKEYYRRGVEVKAMLQQDMTGYVQKTLEAGEPEALGVIMDFVDESFTAFVKDMIGAYCDIPYVETKCGYACSDHASASRFGYPSAFVIESDFKYSDTKIHTTEDKIEYLSFAHMLQHAKMTLAVAYELAFAKL